MKMERSQPQWLPPVAPAPEPARAPAPRPQRSLFKRFATPIFFGILALLKWGKALLLLLPKAKLLTTSASMLVSVAIATDDEFWRALAFTGFFLNLFNLLPVVPLDGGRAMAAMAPWMWFVGFGALLVLLIVWPNPILLIIVLFGGLETYRRWKQRKRGEEGNAAYYRVRPLHRLLVALVYVGLIVALAFGMDATHVERTFG